MAFGAALPPSSRFECVGCTVPGNDDRNKFDRPVPRASMDGSRARMLRARRAPDALAYFFRKKERPVAVFISLPAAGLGTARLRIWSQE